MPVYECHLLFDKIFFFGGNVQDSKMSEKYVSDSVENTSLKCDACGSSFKKRQNLKMHIQSVHERKKPFKCNFCDTSFSQKGHMNYHIKFVHEGKKPFLCNVCDTAFSETAN